MANQALQVTVQCGHFCVQHCEQVFCFNEILKLRRQFQLTFVGFKLDLFDVACTCCPEPAVIEAHLFQRGPVSCFVFDFPRFTSSDWYSSVSQFRGT